MNSGAISKRHILVVDDEPLICETVTMLLQFDGHLVESAHSVHDALVLFEPGKFDVVITDFFMPTMNGEQLAVVIKSRDPVQPVVMLTAYPEKLQSRGHPVSGVDFFVAKPLEIEELRHAIARFTPAEA